MVGESAKKVMGHIIYFGCGFAAAMGTVFGQYAPFGISLAAAVPFGNVFPSVLGSALGYILFSGGGRNFRYIAAILAVIAIRWTLNDLQRLNRHPLYAPLTGFVPTMATGIAVMSVNGFTMDSMVLYGLEALLAGAGAYFFARTVMIVNGTKSLGMLLPQEIACLILSSCIGLLALSEMTVATLSTGRMIAVLCILLAARYGGVTGGSIAGIAVGIVMGIASSEYYFLGAAYAFGGLVAGLFAPMGRLMTAVMFFLSAGIASLQSQDLASVIRVMEETVVSGSVFLLLPRHACNFVTAVFSRQSSDRNCEGLRRSIIMRLDFAAKALSGVSGEVEEVSGKLAKIVTPTLENVYQKAVDGTCQRCGMKTFCWEHRDGVTLESFDYVSDKLKRKGTISSEDFREDFKRKCCRTVEMAAAVNKHYQGYLSSEAAAKRVDEIRNVVAGQFCGLGDILGEMAEEYENYEVFDNELADRIQVRLKELGMVPLEVSCRIDYMGRMTVEADVDDSDRNKLKRAVIVKELSKICGRHFDTPHLTAAFGKCRLVMSERAAYDVEIASSQHISGNGQLCGDHFRYFCDGMGRMITVLSDGMGTGGRAAVDGGMAASILSKLIRAGLGFECSLKVVNAALMVKSEDESLATLDVVSVDLYTGEADFLKAGAALSFIRKGGKMHRVEMPSLPAGILPDIAFHSREEDLAAEDIIVMVSDGAIATGEEWIERIIENWEAKSMQELANLINDEATARRRDGHDDDITVIAMRVK